MADIEITGLTAILYAALAAVDEFAIEDIDAGETKRVALSEIKKYVLDNGTIGGTTAGDPADIDSAQTFTNKTLTAPLLNEAVAVTSTASEVNTLHGSGITNADLIKVHALTASAAELNYTGGVTSAIQSQINAILAVTPQLTQRVFSYYSEFTASGTDKIITEATVNTAASIPSGYYVDHKSIVATIYSVAGGAYTTLNLGGGTYTLDITETSIGGGVMGLDEIKIGGLTGSSVYCIAITFRIIATGA